MKKTILLALLVFAFVLSAFSMEVYLLGKRVPDEKFKLLTDQIYVHAVTLLETLNAQYNWDNSRKTLNVTWNMNTIEFMNLSQRVILNGIPTYITAEPVVVDSRFFLPLLDSCKLFGLRMFAQDGQVMVDSSLADFLYYFGIPDGYALNFSKPVNFLIAEQKPGTTVIDVIGARVDQKWFLENRHIGIQSLTLENSFQETLRGFLRIEVTHPEDMSVQVLQEGETMWLKVEKALAPPENHQKKIIVLDPGHGGIDPGGIGPGGLYEKDAVLSIALLLKNRLEREGYLVRMTRTNDTYLELKQRCRVANDLQADLFVSIHLNSFEDPTVDGAELFYYGWDETSFKGRLGRYYGYDSLTEILVQNLVKQKIEAVFDSQDFAEKLQQEFLRAGFHVRKVIPEDFAVLAYTTMPAVLVECGFLSNPSFERSIRDQSRQDAIAQVIFNGIETFLKAQSQQ
ncbi:MAG TPA: N-acetylmuramoyl-L-alanine amidase [Thermotogota bacterium]|nr:N-acetylmuramoyl-L-alanine amidase [Thermotogota bacterium]HRW92312.1 N-acetylmuramoyl-L-alanine amidase [Thermotogota bacterium]